MEYDVCVWSCLFDRDGRRGGWVGQRGSHVPTRVLLHVLTAPAILKEKNVISLVIVAGVYIMQIIVAAVTTTTNGCLGHLE